MTITHRWSVSILAEGDRVLDREQIVELADAVAALGGVATGIGTTSYGAQIVIDAPTREQAVEIGTTEFAVAARTAGLPDWPVTHVEVIGEHEEPEVDDYADQLRADQLRTDHIRADQPRTDDRPAR